MKLITLLAALSTVTCSPNPEPKRVPSQNGPVCDYGAASGIIAMESNPEQAIKELNKLGCYDAAEAYKQENPTQKGSTCDYEQASGIIAFESEPEQAVKQLNKIGCHEAAEAYKQESPSYYFPDFSGMYNFSPEFMDMLKKIGNNGFKPSYYYPGSITEEDIRNLVRAVNRP